jgi:putative intracellular protease/amidase
VEEVMANTHKILVIVTDVSEFEKVGYRTGLWLGELNHFWDVAEEAGYQMDIASPSGGKIPLDPESLSHEVLKVLGTEKRYKDRDYMNLLENTLKVSEIDPADYDAIYMTGGHGVMFDFPKSTELEELTAKFYESHKIVSTVCHGVCGLLEVKLSNGGYLVDGKNLTGFSWNEEVLAKRDDAVPFSLEEELKKRGAHYSTAPAPFATHLVEDGLLITGQNPGSAQAVGQAVVKKLQEV